MRCPRAVSALIAVVCATLGVTSPAVADTAPPFDGTVWLGTGLITPSSPSDLVSVTPAGRGSRQTFDRRTGWVTQDAYLFTATFAGSAPQELIVNKAFGSQEAAAAQAQYFARVVGQLPRGCRTQIDALWIQDGNENVGGGNRSLLLYSGYAAENAGYIEEAMLHECAHTSLDYAWNGVVSRQGWDAAAAQDPGFISTYARDNPTSEDVSESFGPYLAWKLGAASGYSPQQLSDIARQMPHRLAYLDGLSLDLAPVLRSARPSVAQSGSPRPGSPRPGSPRPGSPSRGSPCPRASLGQRATTESVGTLQCRRAAGAMRWQRLSTVRLLVLVRARSPCWFGRVCAETRVLLAAAGPAHSRKVLLRGS